MNKKPPNDNPNRTVILERRFIPAGKLIMKEGDLANYAYLIQSGKVRIFTEREGKRVTLDTAVTGQIIGEMALVFDVPRTASVEAIEDCNLIIITRQTLQQKLTISDPTIRAIVPMLMKRIMNTSNALWSRSSDIDDLVKVSNMIYENIQASLINPEREEFEKTVFPMLEQFLVSLKEFQDKYIEKDM